MRYLRQPSNRGVCGQACVAMIIHGQDLTLDDFKRVYEEARNAR